MRRGGDGKRTYLSERTETDPEERIDSIGDHFSTSDGEHTEDDDSSSPLRLGDVLIGVCEGRRRSSSAASSDDSKILPTHCIPARASK